MSDYELYRGKCKEMSEELIKNDPSLTLVRGYYFCPIWNTDEQHWWCKDKDGNIVDSTAKQFGSKGHGIYTEFDGMVECAECGKVIPEEEAEIEGRYAFCSTKCHCYFVGLGAWYKE